MLFERPKDQSLNQSFDLRISGDKLAGTDRYDYLGQSMVDQIINGLLITACHSSVEA